MINFFKSGCTPWKFFYVGVLTLDNLTSLLILLDLGDLRATSDTVEA